MTSQEALERATRFEYLLNRRPLPGAVLKAQDGLPVKVHVVKTGDRRVLFTHAMIDKDATGWYLSNDPTGLKVMIMTQSHEALLSGKNEFDVTVSALRVVRHSARNTALVCEIV